MEMKSAWFIMKIWQPGYTRPCQISKIEGQKKDGYTSQEEAKTAMQNLKDKGNKELNQRYLSFTFMELWEN